ncbi:MAG: HEAT repeat domain-containing protein, partial [Pirellulaceae bacterium]
LEVVARQPTLEAAVVDALCWVPDEITNAVAERLAGSHEPLENRLGLAALVQGRRASPQQLLAAAESQCEPLQAMALRGLGTQGIVAAASYLRTYLAEERESLRLAAAWSLVRLIHDEQAGDLLRENATSGNTAGTAEIVPWVVACPPLPTGAAWIEQLSQQPATFDRAVFAAGALGVPDLLDWLLDCMTAPAWARQAGEAFTEITGLDILQQDLDAPPPDSFAAGPTDDPADDDVAPDPYERYPWPDPVRIAQWWDRHQSQFSPGHRYFLGHRADEITWLQHVLCHGTQRQRAAAARALAVAFPDQPVFPVALHARRQSRLLTK